MYILSGQLVNVSGHVCENTYMYILSGQLVNVSGQMQFTFYILAGNHAQVL